ncbi:MAG: DUF4912 domain-containing protein [Fimbriimonadaceae bacterium]|nr:DUF4912 domain-containing protein [Fimbriimonadaceae bacterium]
MAEVQLADLAVVELRRLAGQHGITGASRMRRGELEKLLATALGVAAPEPAPLVSPLAGLTVLQLRRQALDSGVRGAARMNKEQLLALLGPVLSSHSLSSAPAAEAPLPAEDPAFGYPESYGVDRVVLLVRDPEWLYSYWDVSGETWALLIQRGVTNPGNQWVRTLRVWDITDPTCSQHLVDIDLDDLSREWYFRAPVQNRVLAVEYGYRSPAGEFLVVARSNTVQVPRQTPSNLIDERYATLADTAYQLSLAGGDPTRPLGSADVDQRLADFLEEGLSSALFLGPRAAAG